MQVYTYIHSSSCDKLEHKYIHSSSCDKLEQVLALQRAWHQCIYTYAHTHTHIRILPVAKLSQSWPDLKGAAPVHVAHPPSPQFPNQCNCPCTAQFEYPALSLLGNLVTVPLLPYLASAQIFRACIVPLPISLSSKDFPPKRRPSFASIRKAPLPRSVQTPHIFSKICSQHARKDTYKHITGTPHIQ